MSVWSCVEGSITLSRESHISLSSAIKDHFGNCEAYPEITSKKLTPSITEHAFNFSYSLENESAFKAWLNFANYIKDNMVITDPRVGMDCEVTIRWIL